MPRESLTIATLAPSPAPALSRRSAVALMRRLGRAACIGVGLAVLGTLLISLTIPVLLWLPVFAP